MNRMKIIFWIFGFSFLISACSSTPVNQDIAAPDLEAALPTVPSGDLSTQSADIPNTGDSLFITPGPRPTPEDPPPPRAKAEFSTNFKRHSVPYSEIMSGGPPKDGIPPIDFPSYVRVSEADEWLEPVEPVILVQVGQESRAYPLQILTWHEIVNDTLGDLPLVVTFCPLCNTAIVFERTHDDMVLNFGTTGRLRFSNLIMYDRQTESWWQQASGEAIVGELLGKRLKLYPAAIISWEEFRTAFPEGTVLSRRTGYLRSYGQNPYGGYDDVNNPPFLYRSPETPGVLPPMARVLTVDTEDEAIAYPYEVLEEIRVANDTITGKPVVVFWEPGTASALDTLIIAEGRDVGTASAFSRQINDRELTFYFADSKILDDQTGSEWNVLGRAVAGELEGTQLEPVVSINHFWFSWAAFKPETRIYQP
jgi:hypothetical protein